MLRDVCGRVALACDRRRVEHLRRFGLLDELFFVRHPRVAVGLGRCNGSRLVRKIEYLRLHCLCGLGIRSCFRRPGNLNRAGIRHLNRFTHERLCRGGQRSAAGAHRNAGSVRGLIDSIVDGTTKIHHNPGHRLRLSLELGHPDLGHERRVHRQQSAAFMIDDASEVENQTPRIRQSECLDLQRPIGLEFHHYAVARSHGHDFKEIRRP